MHRDLVVAGDTRDLALHTRGRWESPLFDVIQMVMGAGKRVPRECCGLGDGEGTDHLPHVTYHVPAEVLGAQSGEESLFKDVS